MRPPSDSGKAALVYLPLERIEPNPLQPRRSFDEGRLQQLADSIAHQGVIQPLLVRPHPEGASRFELIAGERRLRAMRLLGWPTTPALVLPIADGELLETSLVENLQREALTPIEEAQALRDLLERHGYTQETLARRIGRDRSTIANLIRLLALPVPIQEDLESGRLTAGHARALLALHDPVMQIALRNEVLRRGLSVRETERWVRRQSEERPGAPRDAQRAAENPAPPRERALAQALERRFGTRARIVRRGDQGCIELEFFSLDDFNRIFDLLMGRGR
jgi:ParB family chromosome partitioning protein